MSDPPKPFSIDLASLETRRKDISDASVERADSAGEQHGFVNREPPRKWGRRPRTGQVHAKVMPNIADEISNKVKAARRSAGQSSSRRPGPFTRQRGPEPRRIANTAEHSCADKPATRACCCSSG